MKAGIDITRERVLVSPVLHYRNGGLVIDTEGRTTLPRIFAAGEITGGVHGTNRLMGNSLLDTVVYGRRAGRAAAEVSR
jgi:aspartate oxidase